MIEHKEPFGVRVVLEDESDVRAVGARADAGFWGWRRIDRIEPTHFSIAGGVNMIDVHLGAEK